MGGQCGLVASNAHAITVDPAFRSVVEENAAARMECTRKVVDTGPEPWEHKRVSIVLHDVYGPGEQPLPLDFIREQIDVLNRHCNPATIPDGVPVNFRSVFGKLDITFELAVEDVSWSQTSVDEFLPYDAEYNTFDPRIMSNWGGGKVYRPHEYMNVYVCNLPSALLGYAPYPKQGVDYPGTDAIVVNRKAFGVADATNSQGLYTDNQLGITLVHEVGHYFGLPHIWGESDGTEIPHSCTDDDGVADTPPQFGPNSQDLSGEHRSNVCPGHTDPEMYMNFMDIGPDKQLVMFTKGQVEWMHNQILTHRPGLLW